MRKSYRFPLMCGPALLAILGMGCSGAGTVESSKALPPASAKLGPSGKSAGTGMEPADLNALTAPVAQAQATAPAPRPAQPAPAAGDRDLRAAQEGAEVGAAERQQAFAHFMKAGRDAMGQARYDEAARAYEEATRLMPGNEEAARNLTQVRQLLGREGGGSFGAFQSARDREQGRISEGLAQINLKIADGKLKFDNRDYKDAIGVWTEALDICRWLRGSVDTSGQERALRAFIEEAKKRMAEQRKADLTYNADLVQETQEIEKQTRIRRWEEEVRALYDGAKNQFDREEYDECMITLAKILWKDPHNDDVIRLREYCRSLKYQKQNRELKTRMASAWNTTLSELEEAAVPMVAIDYEAELPSIERWREIEMRAQRVLESQVTQENPEVARIKDILAQKDVNLRFADTQLPVVLKTLSERSGVNIIPTNAVRERSEDENNVNVDVGNIKLASALRLLMDLLGLSYYIDNGAVIICTKDEAQGKGLTTRIFNVRDLLGGFRPFPGEQIRINRNEPAFDPGQADPAEEQIVIQLNQLPDIVKNSVHPTQWDAPADVREGPSGTLIANNTPEVLNDVAKLLDDLRSSRGLMVTIECRLIEVQDNFLEEIGIDYRGSGGIPPGAAGPNLTAAPLDEFQFGLNAAQVNGNVPIVGRDQSAGIYWSNAPNSEIRARIEQMFDTALGDPDIMTRSGGATFQFAFLDDVQINAILRATKKRERVTLVTAPKVTCFNTQRANITVRNQVAYIEDYNVQAQQNVSIADPQVATIEDGLVMEIRPVISADRRYITVEVQPTIALLQRPMDTLTTTLGGAGSTPVTIQLPEVNVQRIRTTVTVPDGGAFLLGGVRRTRDLAQASGVPLLSEIPILGNLFSRRGRSKLQTDLVIVIKARITDVHEMVNRYDPGAGGSDGAPGSYAPNENK